MVNERLKIPMVMNKRSLNLSTSVGILLAEQIRQIKKSNGNWYQKKISKKLV